MIRKLSLAAGLVAAFALPAIAADTAATKTPVATTEAAAPRGNLFTEEQARAHLTASGFTDVSELTKDSNGAWSGTGMKDGKTVAVAVDVKGVVSNN